MSSSDWFRPKFKWLTRFALAALAGIGLAILASFSGNDTVQGIATVALMVTFIPLLFWLCFIPIMHWRERYRGTHPNIWGGFLVFETSGWSKIFYWFMHVLPDYNRSGRYSLEKHAPSDEAGN